MAVIDDMDSLAASIAEKLERTSHKGGRTMDEQIRREEIVDALQTIKEECRQTQSCELCAFYDTEENDCFFKINEQDPAKWVIKSSEPVWRAFDGRMTE